ncbi:hypothetical protein CEXT_475701 [Caerostris extrusa]|uniref:Uncharacterized protein n=1 Tax=Caerostris extrusa TaxID=172846 RepID=A0AAV4N8U7_CAEEX|nr:hypothetical protein CEXT_475701 [Caerostris extrusa]
MQHWFQDTEPERQLWLGGEGREMGEKKRRRNDGDCNTSGRSVRMSGHIFGQFSWPDGSFGSVLTHCIETLMCSKIRYNIHHFAFAFRPFLFLPPPAIVVSLAWRPGTNALECGLSEAV